MICFICERSGEASGSAQLLGMHWIKRDVANCLLCLKLSVCELQTPAVLLSQRHNILGQL